MFTDVSGLVVRIFKYQVVMILEIGVVCCSETSTDNCQPALRNIAEDRRSRSDNMFRKKRWCGFLWFQNFTLSPFFEPLLHILSLQVTENEARESVERLKNDNLGLTLRSSSKVRRSPITRYLNMPSKILSKVLMSLCSFSVEVGVAAD